MGLIDEARRQEILATHSDAQFITLDAAPDDDIEGDDAPGEAKMELAFKRGTLADWKRYQELIRRGAMGQSDGSVGIEATLYAQGLLLHPSLEEWKALRNDAPEVCQDIGHTLLRVHSGGLKVRLGKR